MPSFAAAAAVVGAVALLAASGIVPTWPGLVHAAGLPPLDVSFDLRVLVARAPSWPVFAVGVAASIGIRGVALATIARGVLGVDLSVARAVGFYAIAAVPLSVAAALEFSGFAAVYAWYAYAGVGLTLVAVVALAVWLVSRSSAATLRRSVALVLAYLAAVGVLGAAARVTARWTVLLLVPSALLTHAALLAAARPPRGRPPAARKATAGIAAVLAITVASATRPVPRAAPQSVLFLVPGVDTSTGRGAVYRLDAEALGFTCDRVFYYSYRGPGREEVSRGDATCPVTLHEPYGRIDTQRRLDELVDAFASHLEAIRARTRSAPVVVVTHSQGAWIAWEALVRRRAEGVVRLVMLAPSTRTPAEYPPAGVTGPGTVGADGLRLLSAVSRRLGIGSFDPDAALPRELLSQPEALETLFSRRIPPDVDATVVAASLDAPVAPEGWSATGAELVVVDATHTGITTSRAALDALRRIMAGASPPHDTFLAAALRGAFDAFMPPPA